MKKILSLFLLIWILFVLVRPVNCVVYLDGQPLPYGPSPVMKIRVVSSVHTN